MLNALITTSIEINADPATIYTILTDLSRYHEWNPHMFEARGEVAVGQKVWLRVKAMDVQPTISAADKDKKLAWRNVLFELPGLVNAEHSFTLTPLVYDDNHGQDDTQTQGDDQERGGQEEARPRKVLKTRLDNNETFWGFAVPILQLFGYLDEFKADFQRVNEALKIRAEEFASSTATQGKGTE
ncbi:hypothetical protein BGZ73_005733 [Actinomortierella ambigua]|nr:hypothetical protein BGZ73_005733 [Actinomortierella ambigua]